MLFPSTAEEAAEHVKGRCHIRAEYNLLGIMTSKQFRLSGNRFRFTGFWNADYNAA